MNRLPPNPEIKRTVCENHNQYPDLQMLAQDNSVNKTNDYFAVPSEPGENSLVRSWWVVVRSPHSQKKVLPGL